MGNDTASQIEYYARAMKAPRIAEAATRLADRARDTGWTHEEYLTAVLSREVSAREASGAELRIRAAGFPGRKSLEEFTFDHQPGLKRDTIAHLGTGVFLTEAKNVVLLGPPGTGKTHLAIGLGIKAAHAGHRVLFATATEWVARLQAAHRGDRLDCVRSSMNALSHATPVTAETSTSPNSRAETYPDNAGNQELCNQRSFL